MRYILEIALVGVITSAVVAAHATDDDLKAMYAYLRTLRPITNHVPPYESTVESASSPTHK